MTRTGQLRRRFVTTIAVSAMGMASPSVPDAQEQSRLRGLEDVYQPGVVIQDRNGDGHIDFVNARMVLGDDPTTAEVSAAANIAARFGFETESLDLPFPESGVRIAVGTSALTQLGVSRASLGVDLEPGIGLAAFIDASDEPLIAVVGGDDAGLKQAALAIGGRAPFVWAPDGPTYGDVSDAVTQVLRDGQVRVISVAVRNAVVDDGAGLRRLDVSVQTDSASFDEAVRALREVSLLQTESVEPDTASVDQDSTSTNSHLRFDGLRLLRVTVQAPASQMELIHVENDDAVTSVPGRRPGGGTKQRISLSNLYTNDGFLGDSDNDLIPDRVDVVLSPGPNAGASLVDLAARIGLESTGMTYPLVVPGSEIDDPDGMPPLVLVGIDHPLVRKLADSGQVSIPSLDEGEGWVTVVPEAFGEKAAVVVVGGDAHGEARAVQQLAHHAPHIWSRGKDEPVIGDVDEGLRRTLSGRSPIGQAAMAVYKLDQIAAEVRDGNRVVTDVAVFVEKADEELLSYLQSSMAERFSGDVAVTVGNLDVQNARLIFEQDVQIPSEVDAFWQHFRDDVLPRASSGRSIAVEARLSEPPEVRQQITNTVVDELMSAGVERTHVSVRIVSAYKQGFSWLSEFVAPALVERDVDEIVIRFAEVGPPDGWPQQAMYTPTRWLLELFPIDEVLSREVGVPLSQIRFEMQPADSVAYEVLGRRGGQTVYQETFEPRIHLRPYFDRFPDYEMSRVTTGWITATVDADTVVNRRIVTDLEAFWDHFQAETLTRIYDHVMRANRGQPRTSDAPHFGELVVEVSLSEPDYQVGVDQEQVASMEALHEEIYFGVLHFFDVLGRLARGQDLSYPGRVIPVVRPKADGKAGSARIIFTGFDAAGPSVAVTMRDPAGRTHTERRELLPLQFEVPRLMSGRVRLDEPGWTALSYRVPVDFHEDKRDEWILRTSARSIDARIKTAEQTAATLGIVQQLRAAGLYQTGLAFDHIGTIDLSAYWGHEFDPDSQLTAVLSANGHAPERAALEPGDPWDGSPLVQWDTPISPPEAARILARMNAFAEANVYHVGESYLGKDIWAMDLVAPVEGTYWSQAKASVRKPTVIYSARQHANEVSSTSHVLKLAELILTDSSYADVLKAVNVVIHPITNPDGAQLAYDLYQITPNHMLHAGYLGALGVDVAAGQGSDDPVYPESKVRPKLWETWLPDIFLNPHGYPSHEWVQIFSEYAGWVRSRVTSQRGWWGMRGWFMPSFNYVDSPDYPRHKDAAFAIRDRITANVNAIPEIRALNRRAYDRYRRYAFAFDSENFKMDFADSVLIYTSITGSSGDGGTMSNPRVTIWSGTTEAPDETASGDWLKLVASAGLAWDKALLSYLVEGNHVVERDVTAFEGGVTFRTDRERPPKEKEEQ